MIVSWQRLFLTVDYCTVPFTCTSHVHVFKPNDELNLSYMYMYCRLEVVQVFLSHNVMLYYMYIIQYTDHLKLVRLP